MTRRELLLWLTASGALTSCAGVASSRATGKAPNYAALAVRLENLRQRCAVPGLSTAVSHQGQVAWARGFGLKHIDAREPATTETVYHVASLTKPFAAVIVAQLVQEGRLSLDAPVTEFGLKFPGAGEVRVRHLLSHTSERGPGQAFRYNSERFKLLEDVIQRATGHSFATELRRRLLEPLGLRSTSPNPQHTASCREAGREPALVRHGLAQGYAPDGRTPVAYRDKFSPATGLVSSCRDLLRFSVALHEGTLLNPAVRQKMFTPPVNARGEALPYAFGWFVQSSRYEQLHWHYGWWTGCSSLLLAVPSRRLHFVVLANSEGLSRGFDLGKYQDVRRSPFARAFLETCVT